MPARTIEQIRKLTPKQLRVRVELKSATIYPTIKEPFYLKAHPKQIDHAEETANWVNNLVLNKEHGFKIDNSSFDLLDQATKQFYESLPKLLREKQLVLTIEDFEPPKEDYQQYAGSDRQPGNFIVVNVQCLSI
jgi:hypothetical protein